MVIQLLNFYLKGERERKKKKSCENKSQAKRGWASWEAVTNLGEVRSSELQEGFLNQLI